MNEMTDTDRTGRLFFGLWPDDEVARRLQQSQLPLEGGRQTHIKDFHLTLAFLGVQSAGMLPDLKRTVDETPFSAMPLTLDRYGEFRRQQVVWAGLGTVPEALYEFRLRLLDMPALSSLSFRREATFVPHVTLASKTGVPGAVFEPIMWRASRMVLAESVGGDAVPRYRILACRNV